jgi:hypothetical protein
LVAFEIGPFESRPMNDQPTLRSPRHAFSSSSARVIYVLRLLIGGAAAGFFLGALLGCFGGFLTGVLIDTWEVDLVGALLAALVLGAIGGIWGLILGLTDATPID